MDITSPKATSYLLILICFLTIGRLSMASSEEKGTVDAMAGDAMTNFFSTTATNFIPLDSNLSQYARKHEISSLEAYRQHLATIKERLEALDPNHVLILNAGSLLINSSSEVPSAPAGAGHGEASAMGGGSAVATDGGGLTSIAGIAGFHEYTSEHLFGSDFLAKAAADGYRFFVKNPLEAGMETPELQSARFADFQKAMGAHFILWSRVFEGALPEISAPVELHVVIKDLELFEKKAEISEFFAAHPETVAVLDVDEARDKDYLQARRARMGKGILSLSALAIPTPVKKLHIVNTAKNITTIGWDFLQGYGYHYDRELISLSLRGLTEVTDVDAGFIAGPTMKDLNLFGLYKVMRIGKEFLVESELDYLDLSLFGNLIEIGDDFLRSFGLRSFGKSNFLHNEAPIFVDLSSFRNIEKIGRNFIFQGKRIRLKGLTYWGNIQTIGGNFLLFSSFSSDSLSELVPDFKGAPLPTLTILNKGGVEAVKEIQRVSTDLSMSPSRLGWMGAVARGTARRTGHSA